MRTSIALCVALTWLANPALAASLHPDADPNACTTLTNQDAEAFSRLAERLAKEHEAGGTAIQDRIAACNLDYDALRQRQCDKAYGRQNLEFLLRHCRYEAWSLARAQCERNLDSISPRYAAFCRAFGRE